MYSLTDYADIKTLLKSYRERRGSTIPSIMLRPFISQNITFYSQSFKQLLPAGFSHYLISSSCQVRRCILNQITQLALIRIINAKFF
jgi:hypothetical protein